MALQKIENKVTDLFLYLLDGIFTQICYFFSGQAAPDTATKINRKEI